MVEVDVIRSVSDIKKVKEYLLSKNVRDYVIFVLGINTGLRASDLLNLKWADVMNADGKVVEQVTVVEVKTGKTRLLTLNQSAVDAISLYGKVVDRQGYLLKSRKGNDTPVQVRSLNKIIKSALAEVGVAGNYGTHTLRKTFGYQLYNKGVSVDVLQKVFGHSSSAITLRYIGIDKQVVADVYKDLNL